MKTFYLAFASFLMTLIVFFSCSSFNENKTSTQNSALTLKIGDTVQAVGAEIRSIAEDDKHNLWIGTQSDGLFFVRNHTIIQFTRFHGLPSNTIRKIAIDKTGIVWIKTDHAICTFNGTQFVNQSYNAFYSVEKGGEHIVLDEFFISPQSLQRIVLPKNSPLLAGKPLSNFEYDVYSSSIDSSGKLLFGTCTAGLCIVDEAGYKWLNYPELGAPIRSICVGKDSTIWIGNNGVGLLGLKDNKLINYSKQFGVDNPDFVQNLTGKANTLSRVWSIVEDKTGSIWSATIDAGIWELKDNQLKQYTTKDGLPVLSISTLFITHNNQLLVGTDGFGLYVKKGNRFEPY